MLAGVKDNSPALLRRTPVPLRVLRWTARIWALLSLGVILLFACGEGLDLRRFTPGELVMFLWFPLGTGLGMVLAWRWEGWGGGLTVARLAMFYRFDWQQSHHWPRGWGLIVLCAPGLLFLVSGGWKQWHHSFRGK